MNFKYRPSHFIKYLGLRYKVIQEIKDYRGIEGWLTTMEAVYLYHFASLLPKNSSIIEIGSWKGKSTYCLAKGLKNGVIHAIDPFNADGDKESMEVYSSKKTAENLAEIFTKNLTDKKVFDKIKVHSGYSYEFVNDFSEVDLIFIDGDHSLKGATFDYENYAKILKKGGYLLFHDYYPKRKQFGPVWVIDNLVMPSKKFEFINLYDSLWVGKKI